MKIRFVAVALIAAAVLVPVTLAGPTEATRACEKGRALLADGKFEGALTQFKLAAKADPENKDYFAECVLLQRVMQIREQLNGDVDDERCRKLGTALYGYYKQHHVRGEAVKLASMMYDKFGCSDSAAMLADAQLDLQQNEAALKTLGDIDASKATPRTRAQYGIALARTGELDAAQRVARELRPAEDWDPDTCLDAARLYALVGRSGDACAALKCSFENTPAPLLAAAKDGARECVDLVSLEGDAQFAAALETSSKIKGCGGCSTPCGSQKSGGCSKDSKSATCDKDADKAKCDHAGNEHK